MSDQRLGDVGEKLMDRLLELAEDTARQILAVYRSDYAVHEKADHTPVTEADLLAHGALVKGLERIAPGVPVISEEAPPIAFSERRQWQEYWLVDPRDGTREFIRGSGEFGINIALIRAGEPVAGLVHVPVSGTSFYAWRGGGAFRRPTDGPSRALHVRSHRTEVPVVAVSRSRRGLRLQRFLHNLGPHETITLGSSLKSCLVAEGRADVYPSFGPTSEWDTAATQCILEESGGRITDLTMRPLRYNTRETLRNPPFFAFGEPTRDWAKYI